MQPLRCRGVSFNSNLVQLKDKREGTAGARPFGFNSNLVQLKEGALG